MFNASSRPGRLAAFVIAGLALSSTAPAAARSKGVVPEGVWVLNEAKSVQLMPGRQTLWIVRDDGTKLVWVAVREDPAGEVQVNSWSGTYGGPRAPVTGTPMMSRVRSAAAGHFANEGEIAGIGPYSEECAVDPGGRRLVCHGRVTGANGVRRWTDDFDWVSPSPISPKPRAGR